MSFDIANKLIFLNLFITIIFIFFLNLTLLKSLILLFLHNINLLFLGTNWITVLCGTSKRRHSGEYSELVLKFLDSIGIDFIGLSIILERRKYKKEGIKDGTYCLQHEKFCTSSGIVYEIRFM